jgi:hypothetical protein
MVLAGTGADITAVAASAGAAVKDGAAGGIPNVDAAHISRFGDCGIAADLALIGGPVPGSQALALIEVSMTFDVRLQHAYGSAGCGAAI